MLATVIDLLSKGTNLERLLYGLWITIKLSLISALFSIIFGEFPESRWNFDCP